MSLLEFCRDVADEIGLVRPSTIVGSNDPTARRMLAVAKAQGVSQARASNWTILQREHEFTTTADTANYAVPDDWYKALGTTAWDRTTFFRMRGNKTPYEWQRLKSSLAVSTSFRRSYRLVVGPQAGSIIIDPTPSATGDTLVIEYLSSYWCEDSNGNGQATWEADTDELRIDEELFRLGLLWRAKRATGLEYADDRADYDVMLRQVIIADMNLPIVNTAGAQMTYQPGLTVADGSWNQ